MEQPVPEVEGIITVVQESRFALAGADGAEGIFLLAPGALENADLERLRDQRRQVRVAFTRCADPLAGIAHAVTCMREEPRP